jgi:hypothetical protein
MPPDGKPQLTQEEKDLITTWIESGGEFEKKLMTYDPEAPIFLLANQMFKDVPRVYSFNPADPEKIKSLNNFYRKVISLGADSPALSVSYFSRQNFELSSLNDLFDISEQVVVLNLNNMPLEDEDLELLSGFQNLEKLYLNFSNLQGDGIQYLKPLKNLKTLSLTGNELEENALAPLGELKGLEKLFIWNTGLEDDQVTTLQESLPNTFIETGFTDDGTVYQLNPPTLKFDQAFFEDQVKVEIDHSARPNLFFGSESSKAMMASGVSGFTCSVQACQNPHHVH